MKVFISDNFVNSVLPKLLDDPFIALKMNRLLDFAYEGQHCLIFESAEMQRKLICKLHTNSNYQKSFLDMLARNVRDAVRLPRNALVVKIEMGDVERWGGDSALLNLNAAISVLEEPLGILVENSKNDLNFLCGLMCQAERDLINKAITKRWVQVLHGGGSSLIEQVRDRMNVPKLKFRTFVLFDSDRHHPDELSSTWEPQPGQKCQGFMVERIVKSAMADQYWMLKRRFIESYMPKEQMREIVSPDDIATVEMFFCMNHNQRWFYHMKKGFSGDRDLTSRPRKKDLYAGLAEDVQNKLSKGFGKSLANFYAQANSIDFNWDQEARLEARNELPKLMRLI